MMSSITPVGEMARQQRWAITTAAYLVGSLAGGLVIGTALGALSLVVRAVVPVGAAIALLGVTAVLGLVADAGQLPLPTWHRQVDERWLTTYRGWVYGLGFGAQLGLGVVTIVTSSATYVVLLAAALSGSVVAGAAIGATFGLVRALPVLAFARVRTPARLQGAFRRVEALRAPASRLTTIAQAAVAAAAAFLFLERLT